MGKLREFVDHVVIIIKENHSFDNYFSQFPGTNGAPALPLISNPSDLAPPHNHQSWLDRSTHAPRVQVSSADVAAYHEYARRFALCDNYFSEVAGPSTPNHLMLLTADSPIIDNPDESLQPAPAPPFDLPCLPALLDQAGLEWRIYGGYEHVSRFVTYLNQSAHNLPSDQFIFDAAMNKLPAVSWVYAPASLQEHAPCSVSDGTAWTVAQVNAVARGRLWPRTVIFITWDDWGGWYDHVKPPLAERWKDATQFRYGSRVGCLVISPFANRGYISKALHSHVSLVRFCEIVFELPTLTTRDANADGMLDCFDFTQKPSTAPYLKPVQWR